MIADDQLVLRLIRGMICTSSTCWASCPGGLSTPGAAIRRGFRCCARRSPDESSFGARAQADIERTAYFWRRECAALWQGWNAALTHWAIVLGDQPHLRAETLRELLGFTAAHPERICQPMYGGHRRHPVLLPKAIFSLLATSTAGDLKQFLQPYQIAGCGVDDAGLELDIDWPEDYHRALQLSDKKNKTLRD